MSTNRKIVQLYRSLNISTPSNDKSALDNAKGLFDNISDPHDGEVVLARYSENGTDVKTVAGIYCSNEGRTGWTYLYEQGEFVRKPVVLYETDGTFGLLGINTSSPGDGWQLTGYDFTPYKYLKCYFKISDYKTSSNYLTPAMVITLPLDEASKAKSDNSGISPSQPCDLYIGGGNSTNPSDRNVSFNILVAVDSTKTKFQVVSEHSIYGTALGGRNDNGRYCYRIEGWFE